MKSLIVDYRISLEEETNLKNMGYNVIKCPRCPGILEALDGHPDMQVNILKNNIAVVQNQISGDFIDLLKSLDYTVILSEASLCYDYPEDILLNAVCADSFILHYLKYTDKNLLDCWNSQAGKSSGEIAQINVKQGYTKCSTAVLGKDTFITSDKGIHKALKEFGMHVLLIPPGDILLPGMNYGFIGGSCGLIEDDTAAFYGDLNNYIYGEQIKHFLKLHKIRYISLSGGKLIDRGSIFRL